MRLDKSHIKSHIRAALGVGATESEIPEAIELALPEAGVVAFQRGFDAWKEVIGAQGIEPNTRAYDAGADA